MALRYVEQNPGRTFMVKAPELYRWSSAAAHFKRSSAGSTESPGPAARLGILRTATCC
jgi:hypothetical protein